MGKAVVVTSGKGGVGKTTSTAAIGAALATTGNRVAVVDFDIGLRNLDLVLGVEREVVFDIINVIQGVANLEQALIRDRHLNSDRIVGLLDSKTIKAENGESILKHLLIARFDAASVACGEMLDVDDVLNILCIRLLGIIPESAEVLRASNLGRPITVCGYQSAASRAYFDTARRLAGESVKLRMAGTRQGFFSKLLGQRAAA